MQRNLPCICCPCWNLSMPLSPQDWTTAMCFSQGTLAGASTSSSTFRPVLPGENTNTKSVFTGFLSPSGLTTKSCYSYTNPSTNMRLPSYRNWLYHKPPPTSSDLPAACSSGPPVQSVAPWGIEPSALLHHACGTAFLTIWGQHRP